MGSVRWRLDLKAGGPGALTSDFPLRGGSGPGPLRSPGLEENLCVLLVRAGRMRESRGSYRTVPPRLRPLSVRGGAPGSGCPRHLAQR